MKKAILIALVAVIVIATIGQGVNYGIIMGVNNYHYLMPLRWAEKDAEEIAEELEKHGYMVKLLTGDKVHKQAIKVNIEETNRKSGLNDILIVFFSGHGIGGKEGEQKGIYTYWDNPDKEEIYTQKEIIEDMQGFRGTKILILDACYQGEKYRDLVKKPTIEKESIEEAIKSGKLDVFIASSASNELAVDGIEIGEEKIKNGIGTYLILKGLREELADLNGDGIITSGELVDYVERMGTRIAAIINQKPEGMYSYYKEALFNLSRISKKQEEPPTKITKKYRIESNESGTEIEINGEKKGTAPIEVEIEAGKHEIKAKKEGYKEQTKTIEVTQQKDLIKKEETERIKFEMEKESGEITINSIPSGANVYINNQYKGQTPTTQTLTVGKYTIKIQKEGYEEYNTQIEITSGIKTQIIIPLIEKKPKIRIESEPSGGSVYINNKYIGITPIEEQMTKGTYEIKIQKEGYTAETTNKTIEKDETIKMTLKAIKTNRAPNKPQQSSPNNGEEIEGKSVTLKWSGSDPDGDTLTYQIYIGTSQNNMQRITSTSGTTYTYNNITEGQTYYWKIIASDGQSSSESETRSIRIKKAQSETTRTAQGSEMVLVKAGTFQMGNTRNDSEGYDYEKPVHEVKITYDYYIGKNEVTFEEYDKYCEETKKSKPSDKDYNGNSMGRGKRPVINVSWFDAINYCNWLSKKEGLPPAYDSSGNLLDSNGRITTDITKVKGYRLPTEAEWEYAARGGHKSITDYKYAGSNNIDEVGWYTSNSGNKTQEVGKKKANELGIYDMSGNVWEWCHDWWDEKYYEKSPSTNPIGPNSGSRRVRRGGSWHYNARITRVAYRYYYAPTFSNDNLGFRLARTVY